MSRISGSSVFEGVLIDWSLDQPVDLPAEPEDQGRLPVADLRHELTDPVVALGQGGEQPPAQRVGGQSDEGRWCGSLNDRRHPSRIDQTGLMHYRKVQH